MNKKNSVVHAISVLQLEGDHKVSKSIGIKLREVKSHIPVKVAEEYKQFLSASKSGNFNLIISDLSTRQADLRRALELSRKKMPDFPIGFDL